MAEATETESDETKPSGPTGRPEPGERGKTVHGEAANAGHRVLAPDDAEVEAYLETALKAPGPGSLARRSTVRRRRHRPPDRRRPRLRQPVRAADRAPRPRARRLLRAAAARHAVRGAGAPRRARDHPVGRPELRLRRGRAAARPGRLDRAGSRSSGICYGAQLMAHELGGDVLPATPPRVRAGERHDHRGRRPVRGHRARAAGLDEPRRLDHAAARGLPGDRPDRLDAVRRPGRPGRNLYGIQFHPEVVHTPRGRDVLRNFVVGIAGVAPTWTAANFIDTTVAGDPRAGRRARPRRPARTAWSSARCRAASTRRSRRRSSIARSAIG